MTNKYEIKWGWVALPFGCRMLFRVSGITHRTIHKHAFCVLQTFPILMGQSFTFKEYRNRLAMYLTLPSSRMNDLPVLLFSSPCSYTCLCYFTLLLHRAQYSILRHSCAGELCRVLSAGAHRSLGLLRVFWRAQEYTRDDKRLKQSVQNILRK